MKDCYDALWQTLIDELAKAGRVPRDTQLARLLVLGAANWGGQWFRDGGRLSLDEIAAGAASRRSAAVTNDFGEVVEPGGVEPPTS